MIRKLSIERGETEDVENIINEFLTAKKIPLKNVISIQRVFHIFEDSYEIWYLEEEQDEKK